MIGQIFISIEDPRVKGRCKYALPDILTVALLTFVCGGDGYQDMSIFAEDMAEEFGLFKDCQGERPSADTFERVMSIIKPEEMQRCLKENGAALVSSLKNKHVAIDGKKLKGSNPKAKENKGCYILNAFVTENRLTINQMLAGDKENEIVVIPKILDSMDIEGATISIDAAGTQVNIARKIREQKAEYLLAVKDNQPSLHEDVIDAFRFNAPTDSSENMEADHGRIEERRCDILPASTLTGEVRSRWMDLKTIVRVRSKICRDGADTETVRYYISSEDSTKAAYYNMRVRDHWSIENQLHWNLDVLFKEDACRARKGYAGQNLSAIRKLALQGIKEHKDGLSLHKKVFKAALNKEYLRQLLVDFKF